MKKQIKKVSKVIRFADCKREPLVGVEVIAERLAVSVKCDNSIKLSLGRALIEAGISKQRDVQKKFYAAAKAHDLTGGTGEQVYNAAKMAFSRTLSILGRKTQAHHRGKQVSKNPLTIAKNKKAAAKVAKAATKAIVRTSEGVAELMRAAISAAKKSKALTPIELNSFSAMCFKVTGKATGKAVRGTTTRDGNTLIHTAD